MRRRSSNETAPNIACWWTAPPSSIGAPDGSIAGAQVRVIDFDVPESNDWLAVNQFTVSEGQHTRRPDVVLFVNGLPLAVIELKNAADENATVWTAFQQLQTYQAQIPALFAANAALVISDGVQARIGTLGAGREWFKPWRTIGGSGDAPRLMPELQVVLEGVFDKRRFLDLLRYFIVFEDRRRRQARQEDGRLPPVPRGECRSRGDAARGEVSDARRLPAATRRASGPAASPAIAESASCGTRRDRARA